MAASSARMLRAVEGEGGGGGDDLAGVAEEDEVDGGGGPSGSGADGAGGTGDGSGSSLFGADGAGGAGGAGGSGERCTKSGSLAFPGDGYGGAMAYFLDAKGSDRCFRTGVPSSLSLYPKEERDVPIFWSGSASFQTFLLVSVNATRGGGGSGGAGSVTVEVMTSIGGRPRRLADVETHWPNPTYPYHTEADLSATLEIPPAG